MKEKLKEKIKTIIGPAPPSSPTPNSTYTPMMGGISFTTPKVPSSIGFSGSFLFKELDGHLYFEIGCEKFLAHNKEEFLSRAFSLLQKYFANQLDEFEKKRPPHIHSAKK